MLRIEQSSVKKYEMPSNVRQLTWDELKCVPYKLIGEGAFARCFVAPVGTLKVCIKLLNADIKYKSILFRECRILLELSHFNLPWIHAYCDEPSHTAIVMSFHAFVGTDVSLHVHDALHKSLSNEREISSNDWKSVLMCFCS